MKEIPLGQIILFNGDSPLIAMNGHGFRQAWMHGSGRLNHPQGAIFETQAGNGCVLHLDTLMCQCGNMGTHGMDWAHKPQQKVHIVNGLIHQGATAVERLGALPPAIVVVSLGTPPFARRFRQGQPTKATSFNRRLQLTIGIAKTRWKDGTQQHTIAIARFDERVAPFHRDLERLFHNHMLARSRCHNTRFKMCPRWRGDNDHIHARLLHSLFEAGKNSQIGPPQLCGHFCRGICGSTHQTHQTGSSHLGQRARMEARDHAAPDDHKTQVTVHRPSPLCCVITVIAIQAYRKPLKTVASSMIQTLAIKV